METSMTKNPTVAARSSLTPYLAMAGRAAEACDFYQRAFGASDLERVAFPDGQPGLMHAQLVINGAVLAMTDSTMLSGTPAGGPAASPSFGHLQLDVAEGRAWWDRAVAAGCTVLAPFERQFWGDDWGLLQDPFGIRWAILQSAAKNQ
jgi:PhnB protein